MIYFPNPRILDQFHLIDLLSCIAHFPLSQNTLSFLIQLTFQEQKFLFEAFQALYLYHLNVIFNMFVLIEFETFQEPLTEQYLQYGSKTYLCT